MRTAPRDNRTLTEILKSPEHKMYALKALKERKMNLLRERKSSKQYQSDPAAWITDRWGEPLTNMKWSDYPIYKNHEWDGSKDPYYNAFKSIAAKRWVSLKGATGIGKTYFLSRLVLWFLDSYENSLVVTTAPKEQQLKLHIWSEIGKAMGKFRRLREDSQLLSMRLSMQGKSTEDKTAGWHAIGFVAGTAADEDVSATKAQGFHRENMLIIIDEMPGVSPKVIAAFENTSVADNNIIVAAGNPDSQIDSLATFSEGKRVDDYRISAYDHPNVVHDEAMYPGAVMRASIQHKIDKYGEHSPFAQSRIRGITPQQSADSLFKLEHIERALKNEDLIQDPESNPALGIDVANSEEGDKAALAWGVGNRCLKLHEFQCPNADHIVDNILFKDSTIDADQKLNNYRTDKIMDYGITPDCIGVDAVGVGVSTVNRFLHYEMNVVSLQGGPIKEIIPRDPGTGKYLFEFPSLRSQMIWELATDFKEGNIALLIDDFEIIKELKKQLLIIKYKIKGGKTYITDKEAMKKMLGGSSPNIMDCLVYWNWVRKLRHPLQGNTSGGTFSVTSVSRNR